MSSPLPDDVANACQAHVRPAIVSRIPRADRQNPVSVSASGSPRINTTSPAARNIPSPSLSSRLPRMSQAPIRFPNLTMSSRIRRSIVSQRSSMPMQRAQTPVATIAPNNPDTQKLNRPSSLDKPLPSPPIAQVVNPNSPPNAERTLVDAESGSLATNWPILSPEDVSHHVQDTNAYIHRDLADQQQQIRSVSDSAATTNRSNPYFVNRNFRPTAATFTLAEQPVAQDTDVYTESQHIVQARGFGSKNPYANSFHAISTGPNETMDSPLARNISSPVPITIPPFRNSKSTSLSVPHQALPETAASSSSSPVSRPMKCGDTKWPLLKDERSQEVTARDSMENASDRSLGAESAIKDGLEVHLSNGTRIRLIKRRSPGTGPVLTIYPDVEAVLRGPTDQVPQIPSPILPNRLPNKLSHERSLGALTDRYTRQARPILSIGATSEVPTQNPLNICRSVTTPVKIEPIRSMQPMRKATSGGFSPTMSPPSDTSPITSSPKLANQVRKSSSQSALTNDTQPTIQDSECESASLNKIKSPVDTVVSRKTSQVLKLFPGDHIATGARQHMAAHRALSNFATSRSNVKNEAHSKKSPSASSGDPLTSRNATAKPSMPNSTTYTASRTLPSQEIGHSHDTSKLRAAVSATPVGGNGLSARTERLSMSQRFTKPRPSVGFVSSVERKAQEPTEKKVKVKRSFRDVFLRRDNKPAEKPAPVIAHKRSFMVDTRSTLAKRLRESKSLSKVHVSSAHEPKSNLGSALQDSLIPELRNTDVVSREANHQGAMSSLEALSPSPTQDSPKGTLFDTAEVVSKIIGSIDSMPEDLSDRLYRLEIAEAVLDSVECYKKTQLSAEKASMHARDAELHARSATVAVSRLHELCKTKFSTTTVEAIDDLIKGAITAVKEVDQDVKYT